MSDKTVLVAQMINDVNNKGYNNGAENSLNTTSTTHTRAILTTRLNNPNVIIRRGRVIKSSTGFMKKFKSPRITPRSRYISHVAGKEIPKKLESENAFTSTPGTKEEAIHNPKIAPTI